MKKFSDFVFIKHTADIKFFSFGRTINKAFINSANALISVITDGKSILTSNKKLLKFKVSGKDYESLLYNFLEEIIFLVDAKNLLLSKIISLVINKKGFVLTVKAFFVKASKHIFSNRVKAVTYNDMAVYYDNKKKLWNCCVVLDV